MDQLLPFLMVKESNHLCYQPHKFIYLTTTDQPRGSYLLPIAKVKGFLSTYANLLSDDPAFHINIILNGSIHHMLCIDVDLKTKEEESHYDLLYKDVVKEIQTEMIGLQTHPDDLFDAYYMTRTGSPNYHLIFPHVYMNRLDYETLLNRLKGTYPSIDSGITGWLLYQSSKQRHQSTYRVMGQLRYEKSVMYTDPELTILLKAKYKKNILPIYTHLFFPCELKWFKTCAIFHYPIIRTDHLSEPNYLLNYVDETTMTSYYLYGTLQSHVTPSMTIIEDVFQWCKTMQNVCTFRCQHPILMSYFKKYHPPQYSFDEDQEGDEGPSSSSSLDTLSSLKALEESKQKIYLSLHDLYSFPQFMAVLTDYHQIYPFALEDMCSSHPTLYGFNTFLYEMTFRYGQYFNHPPMYICKKQLQVLKRMVIREEVECYYSYLADHILPTIPLKVCGKEIYLFIWERRHWQLFSTLAFCNLFLNGLMDSIITSITSDNALKKNVRDKKSKFTIEGRIDSLLCIQQRKIQFFDRNQWLLGLAEPYVLDLKTCQRRLAIPEDYITKHTQCTFKYVNRDLFNLFLQEDAYRSAFNTFKQHVMAHPPPISLCHLTGVDPIDRLFEFLAPIFCDDYDEFLFFIQFIAQGLVGENTRRWLLWMIGDTSNSKTTLLKLIMYMLKNYCGILNQSNFFATTKHTSGNEAASPQLTSVLFDRIVIIEELTSHVPLNVSVLNMFTGNNRIYTRDLYKSGDEHDIHFTLIFSMNTYPNVVMTHALEQRIKILRFKSSFLPECKTYDFERRHFPQDADLNINQHGDAFFSLVIHALSGIHHQQGTISIPESVKQNLHELAM